MSNDTLAYFFRSGICLLVFYSLYWFFLRQEKIFRFNRYYLLSAVVISYLFPLINFSVFFSRGTAAALPGNIVQSFIIPKNISPASATYNPVSNTQFNLIDSIPYIYMAVLFVFLIRLIIGMFKLFLICKKGSRHKTGDYTIVYTKDNIAPFSFFRFIFLNEEKTDKNNINQIIAHERIHITQHHTFDMLFVNFAAAVQWFNPFIWLIKKALKETHEFLADEKVIAQGFDSASYSELLIKQIAGVKAMDFANYFNHLLIKKRLIMLKKLKPGKLAVIKRFIIFPIAIILIFSLGVKAQGNKQSAELKVLRASDMTASEKAAIKEKLAKDPYFQFLKKVWAILEKEVKLSEYEKEFLNKEWVYGASITIDMSKIAIIDFDVDRNKVKPEGKPTDHERVVIINKKELLNKFPTISREQAGRKSTETGISFFSTSDFPITKNNFN